MIVRLRSIVLLAAVYFYFSPVSASETHQPAPQQVADPAELEAFAAYTAEAGVVSQQLLAVLTDMIGYSERYLLAFADKRAFDVSRDEIADGFNDLSERVLAARGRAEALRDPPSLSGNQARIGRELNGYLVKMSEDVAAMKSDFDRLPQLAMENDAQGFDAARAKLASRTSAMLRAESALLTIAQTGQSLRSPEFHLMEAIKNGNTVVGEFLDQLLAAQGKVPAPARAAQISLSRKGIDISIEAAAALTKTFETSAVLQNPGQSQEIAAIIDAIDESIRVEREIASLLDAYVDLSFAIEKGQDIPDLAAQLNTAGAKLSVLVPRRQAAAKTRQATAIAFVKAASEAPPMAPSN